MTDWDGESDHHMPPTASITLNIYFFLPKIFIYDKDKNHSTIINLLLG